MKANYRKLSLAAFGVGTLALLASGCVVTVRPSAHPTSPPPPPPAMAVQVKCGPGQVVKPGRHVWRRGRWVWVAPRCVVRPATWRPGCRWVRGRWVKRGARWVWRAHRLVCPAAPVGPTALPPPPPQVAVTCPPTHFLRGGKYVWRTTRWVWVAPRCVPRPATWRPGCRWVRGRWVRVNNRLRYQPGRLLCPRVVAPPPRPVVVYPTLPPPMRPPATYRRPRCRRGFVYYPGRYRWNGIARRYEWVPGRCIARPRAYRRCRLVPGHWRYYNGRAYYIRPAWRCGRRVVYWSAAGKPWTPPPTYKPFLRWKPCRRGYVHDANGRCVRARRRCPAGFVLRWGRCFKPRPATPRPCPAGFARRGNRCVKVAKPLPRCRPGFALRGNRCVRVTKPQKRCRPGFVLRGNRCIKVTKPLPRCRPGFALRGNRCVRVTKPQKRCRPGFVLRGNRCIKVTKPQKRCRPGFVLRGNRCIKRVTRCPRGKLLRNGRCVKVAPRGAARRNRRRIR